MANKERKKIIMFTYFIKMKKNEWKVKTMFYETIIQIMDNQDEIKDMLDLVKRLYEELKNVPHWLKSFTMSSRQTTNNI